MADLKRLRLAEDNAADVELTLEALKQNRVANEVVVLTSSREEQDLVQTYDLGVNAYVVEPVDFHAFIDAGKAIGGFWAVVNELPA
jgi:DNA-binding NarL/FixJ family response regulator